MPAPTRAFQALHEVAVAASGLREPAALATLVVDRARDLLEADAAALYWWFPETGLLRTLAHNDPREKHPEPPFRPGDGAAGRAFAEGRGVRVDEYKNWPQAVPTSVQRGIQSGLAVPLLVSDRAVGALGVFNRRTRSWTEDEEDLLSLFAAQVAPALEAARLSQETIEQAHNFRALHEVAIAAGGLRDLGELGNLVVDRARQLLKSESATLRWWDATTRSLRLLASEPPGWVTGERIASGQGSLGQAFERQEPVLIENYADAPDTLAWAVKSGIRSAIAAPVMAREQALGAIGVATRTDRRYSREDLQLLTLLAAQIGPALEAARLYAESERRRREAEALAELVRSGAGRPDIEGAIAMIAEQSCRLVGADYALVVLGSVGQRFEVKGRYGTRSDIWKRSVDPAPGGHSAQVIASGATVILASFDPQQHPVHHAEGGRSALGVPLREGEKLIGCLILGWRQAVEPAPEQVQLAEVVAGYAATIINNARAHEREHSLAAEASARSAELAAVIDHIPDGVYVADLEGRITLMNPAGRQMMGIDKEPRMSARRNSYTILEPATRTIVPPKDQAVHRALRGEAVIKVQNIVLTPSGDELWLESSAVPLRNAKGAPTGAVVVFSDVTRERMLVSQLGASEERFRNLYGMIACGVLVQDSDGRVLDANEPAQRILGWTLAEMKGRKTGSLWEAFTEDMTPLALAERPTMRALATGRGAMSDVMAVKRKGGELVWIQLDTVPVFHPDGSALQVVSSFIDITDRKKADALLADSELKLRTIFEGAPIGLARIDLEGRIQEANRALRTMLGYPPRQLVGLRLDKVLRTEEGQTLDLVTEFLAGGREHFRTEVPIRPKDGSERWGTVSLSLVKNPDGSAGYLIGMLEDVTDRRAQTELLEYQALHDGLTDLPNRTLLNDRLQQAILTAQRENRQLALLIMDLDRFKEVNDTFGHHLGDLLLQQAGPRIMAQLRESDTVARLGGDEFAVVLPTADDEAGAVLAARRILKALEEPFEIEDRRLEVSGSIGIAITPQHGSDPATLMRRADIAMYVAKRTRAGHTVYLPEHDKHSPGRLTLMGELRDALQGDALVLHYQPQVALDDGRVVGLEALLRWQHPRHGLMPPEEFLGLAEETGLVVAVSEWSLNAAIEQARAWGPKKGLPIAVNISTQNLLDAKLPERLAAMLESHQVKPEMLKVEVTEGALMADVAGAGAAVAGLRDMGVKVSVDDFGAGYSSLNYLQELKVDELKIDRSFILGLRPGGDGVPLLRSAIDLAHSLGLAVIAEGVETDEAWTVLAELGCDYAQGYLMTKALPPRQLTRWLTAGLVHPGKRQR